MAPGKASATARERARASLTSDIKESARRQLAGTGADGLSLRAVARDLGMVSSAIYRYFPSRDDLLTALIIDSYDAVGAVAEQAAAAQELTRRERWIAACHAVRGWALAHPHEYALIYGSPVPGYRAPDATIGPASRVPLAFLRLIAADPGGRGNEAQSEKGHPANEARAGNQAPGGARPGEGPGSIGGRLAGQAALVAGFLAEAEGRAGSAAGDGARDRDGARDTDGDETGDGVRAAALLRAVLAWTQLFGMISFELFGQFARTFDPADDLFGYAVARMAEFAGL
jgi:AcrR family transcriptional regulator